MKLHTNLLNYCLLVTLLIFSSCQDEEEASRRDMLIGTWEIQSGELSDYAITTELGQVTRSTVQSFAVLYPDILEVDQALEDGTGILFPSGTTITFNDDNSFVLDDQTEVTNGNWLLDSDEETITVQTPNTAGPNELKFDIASLTDQQIDITLRLTEDDVNLEEQGVENLPLEVQAFTIDYNFSFTKQ